MIGTCASFHPLLTAFRERSSAVPGTKEIAAAKRIGAQIIESFWTDAGRGAERLKLRNDHATIGELIERYRASAAQRPATIRSNVRSLRMIVKTVHSGDPDIKPTSILTANLIREFEKRQLKRVEKRPAGVNRVRRCNVSAPRRRAMSGKPEQLSRCER